MKKKNRLWIFSLIMMGTILMLTSGCKKDNGDDDDPDDTPTTASITADKSTVSQLEIVSLTPANITFSLTEYTGSIGGQNVKIVLSEDKLVFIVPEILAGAQTLTTTIEGIAYSIGYTINASAAIPDPAAYYSNYTADLLAQMTELQAYINQMTGIINVSLATQDMQTIHGYIDGSNQNFQNASSTEKAAAVKFIEANQPLFDTIKSSLETLNTSVNDIINAKKSKDNKDYEFLVLKAANNFIDAVNQVKKSIKIVVGAIAITSLFPPFSFVGGFAIVVATANLLVDFYDVISKEEQLLSTVFSVYEKMVEGSKISMSFTNDISQTVPIVGTYRNYYSIDKNSSFSMIAQFVNSMQIFTDGYNYIISKLPDQFNLTPRIIENVTTKNTTDLPVHAKYLGIGTISNSKVSGSAQNNNGVFVLTFHTNEATDQHFNFNVVYNHNGFASETETITDAVLIASPPYSISKVAGCDNQVGQLGHALANPIKVIVKNQAGSPSSGVKVYFTANNGGSVSQAQVITGVNGIASVTWTLGSVGATQSLTVTAFKSDNITPLVGSPLTFIATQMPPIIGTWEMYSGSSPAWTFGTSQIYHFEAMPETFGYHVINGYVTGYSQCDTINVYFERSIYNLVYIFNSNGTFTEEINDVSQGFGYTGDFNMSNCTYVNTLPTNPHHSIESGSWTLNGNTLILDWAPPSPTLDTFTVSSLNSTYLELLYYGSTANMKFNKTAK